MVSARLDLPRMVPGTRKQKAKSKKKNGKAKKASTVKSSKADTSAKEPNEIINIVCVHFFRLMRLRMANIRSYRQHTVCVCLFVCNVVVCFHGWRCSSAEFAECVEALLSYLPSLAGLEKLVLVVSCLTEGWANKILTLIQACPSLVKIT